MFTTPWLGVAMPVTGRSAMDLDQPYLAGGGRESIGEQGQEMRTARAHTKELGRCNSTKCEAAERIASRRRAVEEGSGGGLARHEAMESRAGKG